MRKLETVKIASFYVPSLTQYQSMTDGQTDAFATAYTALAKLALRNTVKTVSSSSQPITSLAHLMGQDLCCHSEE